ncbi:MAG: L-threonylcarbamoyladenylate synthase [Leptospirillia bacterium]
MEPPVFPVLAHRPGWSAIRQWLRQGGVLGFPAEYAYALAEVPLWRTQEDKQRLYKIKGRPHGKPVLYLAGSLQVVARFATLPGDPRRRRLLTDPPKFLTFLLPATPLARSLGMAKNGKVAFRIPPDPVLRQFLVFLDAPLSGTSLNPSGQPPLTTPEDIRTVFPDLALVDGGFKPGFPVSPIVDLSTGERRVLRGSWRQFAFRIPGRLARPLSEEKPRPPQILRTRQKF